jgi:hypothetical protein
MEPVHDDCFVVYLRHDLASSSPPENGERPFKICSSYGEARRIQRELHQAARDCVIRYVGTAGGGD